MHREWITKSEQETLAVGKSIAASLKPGDVLALNGDLGAGKTVFVRGIARGLGVEGIVNSPTYTICPAREQSMQLCCCKGCLH